MAKKAPGWRENLRTVGVYGSLLGSYFTGLGISKLNGSPEEGRRFMLTLFSELSFALAGLRVKVRNQRNLWQAQPAVVIFNHQSQADGLIMIKLLRDNFAAVGKKEIARFKLLAKAYEFAGIIPIDRANSASAIEAMQPLVHALVAEGRNVVIAPEGTRSETSKPLPFKKGAFHVAMQAGVPIVPVVLHGAMAIQPRGQFAFCPGEVEVEVLPPVETTAWRVENLDVHIAEVRNLYLSALGYDEEPLPRKRRARKRTAERSKRSKGNATA